MEDETVLNNPAHWIVPELAFNNHKYQAAEDASKENGNKCVCGYPAANHPYECFSDGVQ